MLTRQDQPTTIFKMCKETTCIDKQNRLELSWPKNKCSTCGWLWPAVLRGSLQGFRVWCNRPRSLVRCVPVICTVQDKCDQLWSTSQTKHTENHRDANIWFTSQNITYNLIISCHKSIQILSHQVDTAKSYPNGIRTNSMYHSAMAIFDQVQSIRGFLSGWPSLILLAACQTGAESMICSKGPGCLSSSCKFPLLNFLGLQCFMCMSWSH